MPISFARSGWIGYKTAPYRDWITGIILATKNIPHSMDHTRGALYRCAAAGTGFLDRVRGVRNVYVITGLDLVGHQYQGTTEKDISGVDVRFHGAYYSILCERQYRPARDIPFEILRINAPRQPEAQSFNPQPPVINPGGAPASGGGGSAGQYANIPQAQYANIPQTQYANNPKSNYGTVIPVNPDGIYANIPSQDESPYANFPENYHADNNGLIR